MPIQIPSVDIGNIVHVLERRDLDSTIAPDSPPIWGQLENVTFVRIHGQSAFWRDDPSSNYGEWLDDVLASVHGQGLEFQFLVVGHARETAIFVGLAGLNAETILRATLTSTFPGIELDVQSEATIGRKLNAARMFSHRGRLTGIPTRKGGDVQSGEAGNLQGDRRRNTKARPARDRVGRQMERLITGLAGEAWGLWVRALPYPVSSVTADSLRHLDTIAAAASLAKRQIQQLNQTLQTIDGRTQAGSTESISGEIINRQAEYAVSLLEHNLQRLDEAKAVGMWETELHFFSPKSETFARAQSLVRAVFAGQDSTPQPVRVSACGSTHAPTERFITKLTSREVATLAQLPRIEVPGYRISDYARFDTDFEPTDPQSSVEIGPILDGNRKTGQPYCISFDELAKHALVVGMTGSGKTTSVFSLLDKVWNDGHKPFLVIEPAKAEYRHLRGKSGTDGRGDGPVPELRIYTLGDETVAPLRLNPFEFEIGDRNHRIHIQTHIDYLKSVFNAAFILYAPMPYVLETCLHEVYTDRGWDLTTGLNHRVAEDQWNNASKWPLFPTLSDLYYKIDEVTERLGYEERIEMDVKAGLKARIGSLRLGSKGLMLDTDHGVPMAELLSVPTVLELERIGNDDEKAFLIGLVMTRLYEYRRVQSMQSVTPAFQHLLVIEEAHRLLKNVSTEVETESANTKGQAVETFANMLAEIRAYGQGVLIAEQVPTKLAPDAVKNTNLKMIHRLVAADDRELMADSMNMDESQRRYVATLPPGRAAVFSEKTDHPCLVQMEDFKKTKLTSRVSDREAGAIMEPFVRRSIYDPVAGYRKYIQPSGGMLDSRVRDFALSVLARPEFTGIWSGVMLALVCGLRSAQESITGFSALVLSTAGDIDSAATILVSKTAALFALTEALHKRGRYFNWTYAQIEELQHHLTLGLMHILDGSSKLGLASFEVFADLFRERSRVKEGPFAGCAPCKARCLLRHDTFIAAAESSFQREIARNVNQAPNRAAMYAELSVSCLEAADRLAGSLPREHKHAVALCIISQVANQLGWSQHTQRKLAVGLADTLDKQN